MEGNRTLRAAIYASASNWAPLTRRDIPIAEQSARCREAIEARPYLKRVEKNARKRRDGNGS